MRAMPLELTHTTPLTMPLTLTHTLQAAPDKLARR
jgi:hypothetical protein